MRKGGERERRREEEEAVVASEGDDRVERGKGKRLGEER